jgi:CheY-like chemotaxis protein
MTRKKILVVDDSPIILKTLSTKLDASGYEVFTAEDGATAVSVVRRTKPDLILLDISFPPDVAHGGGVPWDGFRIMDWLKRMDEGRNIPTIVITGSAIAQYKDRALAAGAVSCFQKPIDHDQLLTVIGEALAEHAGAPQPQV